MIAIIDYGMGNLRSVQKGLERVGGDARIVSNPADVAAADQVVLPGVGAFRDAIAHLRDANLDQAVHDAVASGKPFLGVCLGYQLLFERAFEGGEFEGLGVFPGEVVHFREPAAPHGDPLKVPHMGWNQLRFPGRDRGTPCPLFAGIDEGAYVYFVHSYHPETPDASIVAATSDYGYEFPAATWRDNVFGTQFHPEKSQAVGLAMLKNFVALGTDA